MRYLLDTNVICESVAKQPDKNVMSWMALHQHESALSCVTFGEIWKGIHRLPEGKRRETTMIWVNRIEDDFRETILPLNLEVLKIWGQLFSECQARGLNLTIMDSLLAATALADELTLVTRNTRDFPAEVPTLNPWL